MVKFNEEKALAAILFLANQNGEIDLYALLKTLYCAEKSHLHEWGRTITGDDYHRIKFGAVPTNIYDMVKSVRGQHYWHRNLQRFFGFKDKNTIVPLKHPDMSRLSESDVEELVKSFKKRGHLKGVEGFRILMEENHNDKAFLKSKDIIMTQEELAEDDPILLEYLERVQEDEEFLKSFRTLPPRDEEELCEREIS